MAMMMTYPIDKPDFAECDPVGRQCIAHRRQLRFVAEHEFPGSHPDDRLAAVASYHQIGGHFHEEVFVGSYLGYAL